MTSLRETPALAETGAVLLLRAMMVHVTDNMRDPAFIGWVYRIGEILLSLGLSGLFGLLHRRYGCVVCLLSIFFLTSKYILSVKYASSFAWQHFQEIIYDSVIIIL